MGKDNFQPIPVSAPSKNPLLFGFRCIFDLQFKTIVRYLKPAMDQLRGRVLNVGAGEAPWRDWLPRECRYQGIDVAWAHEFGMTTEEGNSDILSFDGLHLPFPAVTFDAAFCVEVQEHVPTPETLLAGTARVLRSGAPLLLTVPWCARYHHRPHDYHPFSRERLAMMPSTAGVNANQIPEKRVAFQAH